MNCFSKRHHMKSISLICVLTVIFVILAGCSREDDAEKNEQSKIHDLTAFNAYTLKDNIFTNEMFADYDATILFFWTPWSDASIYELRNMGAFYRELPENIFLTTVCMDSEQGDPKSVLKQCDMSDIRTFVEGDADFKTVTDQILNIPTTIIVDKNGKIIGGPIVGIQINFEKTYLKELNSALKKARKKAIELNRDALLPEEMTEEATTEESDTVSSVETTEDADEGQKDQSDKNGTSSDDDEQYDDEQDDSGESDYDQDYSDDSQDYSEE